MNSSGRSPTRKLDRASMLKPIQSTALPLPCHLGSPGRYALPKVPCRIRDALMSATIDRHTPLSPRDAAGLDGHGGKPGPGPKSGLIDRICPASHSAHNCDRLRGMWTLDPSIWTFHGTSDPCRVSDPT